MWKHSIRMHKLMLPHGDYDHMGEAINLVNNEEVERMRHQMKMPIVSYDKIIPIQEQQKSI